MSRHKRRKPACFSTVPISIPKRVVPGGMLIVGSRFAVCVGSPEPAAPADAGVGDFQEEPEDPAEVAEDVVDGVLADLCGLICTGDGPSTGLSPEMDEVAGGRTALAFGAGSAVAVGLASEPSLAAAVARAKSGATDGSPRGPPELPSGFAAKSCGPAGAG
jgi:hypothetical protein